MQEPLRYKLLVVEDDPQVGPAVVKLCQEQGLSAFLSKSAAEALVRAADSQPDLVLADVQLPEMDGHELCRRLKAGRRTAHIPVILMSGVFTGEEDQADGLEEGADDYLLKPFRSRLLLAKIGAVLRRYAALKELEDILQTENIKLNLQARTTEIKGKKITLTRKEFDLLTTFLRKRGRLLTTAYLLETIWGLDPAQYNDPRTVKAQISSLRQKLGPGLGRRLINVRGLGYRLDARKI